MSNGQLSAIRRIGRTPFTTPMLVPSYSSRGFPVGSIFELLSPYTTSTCLISAYDIYHRLLPRRALFASDLVFVDSGGYEGYASSELSRPASWSLRAYRRVLRQLEERTTIVPVTFDYENRRPTAKQFGASARLIEKYPMFHWDCLIKPEGANSGQVNVNMVVESLPFAPTFAILGFVEQELGRSILERARNIARIRRALVEIGNDLPIHIFGCLDPGLVRYYAMAGADIFDGLQWLRNVITEGGTIRMSTVIVRDRLWENDEDLTEAYFQVHNLDALHRLQTSLRRFAGTGRLSELGLSPADQDQPTTIGGKQCAELAAEA